MGVNTQEPRHISASLEDSEERYRALANASSEGIVMHRNGIIIEANEEFARIIGHPIETLSGANILSLLSRDARSTVAAQFNSSAKHRTYEITGVRPNGERYYAEVRSNEITFQHRPTRVATVREVTERKAIEENLRRLEQESRRILKNMQDTYYRTDINGLILMGSASVYDLLLYTEDELLGKPLADIYVYPEERAKFLDVLAKSKGKVKQYRTYVRRKDGKKIWVSTSAQYYYDSEGNIAGVEGTSRDITPMVEAEEKLKQALDTAEAASRAKGEFLAMMSHEIRTPMNGVLTTAQLLENTNLDAEQRRYVETINSSGRLLYTLLNDVLDLSKLEAGKLQLERENFEVNQMLSNLLALVEPMARAKGLEFRLSNGAPGQLWLCGDEVRLQQILLNLLSNAVKFTDKGFIALSLEVVEQGKKCQLDIAVRDSGIGINQDEQKRLFKPFEQGDMSITRRFGGTGLGLAITRDLVKLIGGEIRVTSKEHSGACFTLALPFEKGTKIHDRAQGTNLSKVFAFLLVEDDDVNRGAMSALLEKDGHRVTPASNGFQALEILGSGATFDYLLIDVHMPGIDGIETLRRWKNAGRGGFKRIRIVALTADTRMETVERCREVGVDLVLPKPLRKRDLYALINNEGELAMAENSDHGMPPAEGLVDETYVAQLAGDIGIESLGTNIELFKRTGVEVNRDLLHSLEQGDIPGVKFWAHRLAGSCRMVGLAVLADSANRIEALTRDAAPADLLGEAIADFQSLYTESVRALDKWLQKAKKHS